MKKKNDFVILKPAAREKEEIRPYAGGGDKT